MTIAALYVQSAGVYYGLEGVEAWGTPDRDARDYKGPHAVVAHPPCKRWGRYWYGNPTIATRLLVGDDQGCFDRALWAVDTFGGVLEHPEASHAWTRYGLAKPPKTGGWIESGLGWTCCVEQGHYGHRARKATWLYYRGPKPPELVWGPAEDKMRMEAGYHTAEERERKLAALGGAPPVAYLTQKERARTPIPFRNRLLTLAMLAAQEQPGEKAILS